MCLSNVCVYVLIYVYVIMYMYLCEQKRATLTIILRNHPYCFSSLRQGLSLVQSSLCRLDWLAACLRDLHNFTSSVLDLSTCSATQRFVFLYDFWESNLGLYSFYLTSSKYEKITLLYIGNVFFLCILFIY